MGSVTQWLAGTLRTENGRYKWDQQQRGTNGAAHVALPENVFGIVSTGEQAGTDTIANYTYTFASGLNGVTVENINSIINATAPADSLEALIYVAFNNTAFNDAAIAGLRHVIGPNSSKSFSFDNTPKPTQMTIRIDAIETLAVYTAAEA